MKGQAVSIRDKHYFVCDYTGAPCQTRYFIPTGKLLRGRTGCYASLPILLRAVYEQQGNKFTSTYLRIKKDVEAFYNQPDVPMQPPLPLEEVPLSENELAAYMARLDMGQAWQLVPKGVPIDSIKKPKNKRPSKRAKVDEEEELEPTQILE